jgi:Domain of unknown function (DUF4190)
MSEGSSGEPERDQGPRSQPADSAQPGPAAAQPDYPSAGPDSWSTTWADPVSPARPTAPAQPGSSGGTGKQVPPTTNGFSPAGADPSTAPPGGHQPPAGQYPPPAAQYGYQPAAEQYPQTPGQYGDQPTGGQYPAPAGQYAAPAGQYPAPAGQYAPQQWPGYPATPRNNRVAIAALVCGVGQFVLGLLIVGNIVLAIPAIICGAIGLKQTSQRGEAGRGMAIAGLVLGILGVVYFVIIAVVLIILASIHDSGSR